MEKKKDYTNWKFAYVTNKTYFVYKLIHSDHLENLTLQVLQYSQNHKNSLSWPRNFKARRDFTNNFFWFWEKYQIRTPIPSFDFKPAFY